MALFDTAVQPARRDQVSPFSATERRRTREKMLAFKAAVSVLASFLLLMLITIASLIMFIVWKLRKLRDRSGKKACCMQQVLVYVAINTLHW